MITLKFLRNSRIAAINSHLSKILGICGMHSTIQDVQMWGMNITILPALQDNYMYLITDTKTREAAVVDPVNPELVLKTVERDKVNLTKILTTHHHWDHSGGNKKLLRMYPQPLDVYGADDRIDGLTVRVQHNYCFSIGKLKVLCIATPCHTKGHMCYYVENINMEHAIFTGDTLFQGGCGHFFEGTAEQMYDNLNKKFTVIPYDTQVYCGHEYTLKNLTFAQHVEPKNDVIGKRLQWAKQRRAILAPTIPSTIGQERQFNPFMRVNQPSVQQHVSEDDPIATMATLRREKNSFKA